MTLELRENSTQNWIKDIYAKTDGKTLTIFFGDTGDLYFNIFGEKKRNEQGFKTAAFHINIEDELYSYFETLINDVVTCNVYDEFNDNLIYATLPSNAVKKNSLNQRLRENNANQKLLHEGVIEIYSESIYDEAANLLRIKQKDGEIILEFIDNPNDPTHGFGIRISNHGSRYYPFNNCFMKLFNKLQNLSPKQNNPLIKKKTPCQT